LNVSEVRRDERALEQRCILVSLYILVIGLDPGVVVYPLLGNSFLFAIGSCVSVVDSDMMYLVVSIVLLCVGKLLLT